MEWLTPASKVGILAIIASLNAVWGYPLVGLLASLITLLLIAAVANWLLRPRLSAVMRIPEFAVARSLVDVSVTVENKASTPVFDLSISLVDLPKGWRVASECRMQKILQLNSQQSATIHYKLQVGDRAECLWPTLRCESTFPFSLFRSRQDIVMGLASSKNASQWVDGGRTWVTPAAIDSDVPALIQSKLWEGQLCHGVRSGESLEYIGSREYCHGNYVKRWDFASWARLGRPIVREFDQGSTGNVSIFVDTLVQSNSASVEDFETRLCVAASIVYALRQTPCEIGLIMPTPTGIESHYVEHTRDDLLLRSLSRVVAMRSDRPWAGLKTPDTVWSSVEAALKADHTLICIMAPPDFQTNDARYQSGDNARQNFLKQIKSLPSSVVVFPTAKNRAEMAHD